MKDCKPAGLDGAEVLRRASNLEKGRKRKPDCTRSGQPDPKPGRICLCIPVLAQKWGLTVQKRYFHRTCACPAEIWGKLIDNVGCPVGTRFDLAAGPWGVQIDLRTGAAKGQFI